MDAKLQIEIGKLLEIFDAKIKELEAFFGIMKIHEKGANYYHYTMISSYFNALRWDCFEKNHIMGLESDYKRLNNKYKDILSEVKTLEDAFIYAQIGIPKAYCDILYVKFMSQVKK